MKVPNNKRNIYEESSSMHKWILLPSACLFRRRRRYHTVYLHASSICSIDFGCKQKYLWSCFLVLMFVQFFFLLIILQLQKAPYQVTIKLYMCSAWPCSLFTKKYYSSQFELISYPFLHWRSKLVRNKKCRWITYFIHYSFICSFFRQK